MVDILVEFLSFFQVVEKRINIIHFVSYFGKEILDIFAELRLVKLTVKFDIKFIENLS